MVLGIREDVPYDSQHGDRRQDLFHCCHSGDVAQPMAGFHGVRFRAGRHVLYLVHHRSVCPYSDVSRGDCRDCRSACLFSLES